MTMPTYSHTQRGTLVLWAVGFPGAVALLASSLAREGSRGFLLGLGIALLASALQFHSMKVTLEDGFLRFRMGLGLIRGSKV